MIEFKVYAMGVLNIPSLVFCAFVSLIVIGSGFILLKKGWDDGKRAVAILLLIGWVVLIYSSTVVFRDTMADRSINLVPLWSYFDYAENSYLKEMAAINALNVIMFLPIGFLLRYGLRNIKWTKALGAGVIFSLLIEVSQFLFCKGLCEMDDVIHNVLGCMTGFWVAEMITRIFHFLRPMNVNL